MIRTNNSIVTGRIRSRRIISAVVTVNSDPDGVLDGGPGDMCYNTTNGWLYVKSTPLGNLSGWRFLSGDRDTGWRGWNLGTFDGSDNIDEWVGWPDPNLDPVWGSVGFHYAWRRIDQSVFYGLAIDLSNWTDAPYFDPITSAVTYYNDVYLRPLKFAIPAVEDELPEVERTAGNVSGSLSSGVTAVDNNGNTVSPRIDVEWVLAASNRGDYHLPVVHGFHMMTSWATDWAFIQSARVLTDLPFPEDPSSYPGDKYTPPVNGSAPVFG